MDRLERLVKHPHLLGKLRLVLLRTSRGGEAAIETVTGVGQSRNVTGEGPGCSEEVRGSVGERHGGERTKDEIEGAWGGDSDCEGFGGEAVSLVHAGLATPTPNPQPPTPNPQPPTTSRVPCSILV